MELSQQQEMVEPSRFNCTTPHLTDNSSEGNVSELRCVIGAGMSSGKGVGQTLLFDWELNTLPCTTSIIHQPTYSHKQPKGCGLGGGTITI